MIDKNALSFSRLTGGNCNESRHDSWKDWNSTTSTALIDKTVLLNISQQKWYN